VFVFLYYCGVLFCFLTNVDVRLLHLNKPVSQSVSQKGRREFSIAVCYACYCTLLSTTRRSITSYSLPTATLCVQRATWYITEWTMHHVPVYCDSAE